MNPSNAYWICTWQRSGVGERMPENCISGPFQDLDEARLCRERIGLHLAIFQIADIDKELEDSNPKCRSARPNPTAPVSAAPKPRRNKSTPPRKARQSHPGHMWLPVIRRILASSDEQ